MALSDKQKAFCEEYVVDFNAKNAAIRAGYSPRSAASTAHIVSNVPEVKAEIERQIELRSRRTYITQDRVLMEIARLAFNDPRKAFDKKGNLLPIKDWPDEIAAAVSSIKVFETQYDDSKNVSTTIKEVKFWDKGKQLELAGKHLAMFTDKINISGNENGPIEIDIKSTAARIAGLLAIANHVESQQD